MNLTKLFVETEDETKYIYKFVFELVESNDEVDCSYQIKNLDSLTENR